MIFTREAENSTNIEVWTDGSIGEIPSKYIHHLNDEEPVSVKWDEGWYATTLSKFLAVKVGPVYNSKSDNHALRALL